MVIPKVFFAEDRKKGWTRAAVDLAYNGECRSVSPYLMHDFLYLLGLYRKFSAW
jgi:hypothetical protein